jgi:hypothetical protein
VLTMVPGGYTGQGAPDAAPGDEFAELAAKWEWMVRGLKANAAAVVKDMRPLRLERDTLVVGGPIEVHIEKANRGRGKLEETFEKAAGRKVRLKFEHAANGGPEPQAAPEATPAPAAPPRKGKHDVSLEDLAAQTFDATVEPDES